jgi:diketogulonate reductase-like aldo/keto reductase
MMTSINDFTVLNNGSKMPWLGLGVYQAEDGTEVENAVKFALRKGYRSIDTASVYGNEVGVGKAIAESEVPRGEIFLTTKVWNDDQREKRTLAAFDESLNRLGVDYVDLYLVHWPVKGCYQETWKAMEEIYASGRAKAIGVSNFLENNLKDILADCKVVPAVNQMECHPYLLQPELLAFCKENNIQMEAWSPLMQGHIMEVDLVKDLAKKYQKTPAQITLRWNLQHGIVTIPKSVHRHRIIENSEIFDFEISKEDMTSLDALDRGKRFGPDPADFNF